MSLNSAPYDLLYPAPFAWLGLRLTQHQISSLELLDTPAQQQTPVTAQPSPLAEQVAAALTAYFAAPGPFALPLAPLGSAFQQRVWAALCAIPVGTVLTYGQLAARLGTAPRAIGAACRSNPIILIIPCHRVVAAQGLGGYMGSLTQALRYKRWLLAHEGWPGIKDYPA